VFKIQADTAAEFQAFKAGEVSAIYPQPQLDAVDAINAGLPDTEKQISVETGNFESLWLNYGKPPFDNKVVRQAIGFAIDRDAIVNRLFGGLGVDKALNVVNAKIVKQYSDENAFSNYKLDLAQVDKLLTGDGWAKGSDGIYAKAGQRLSFVIRSTSGNKRRELTEQILQEQLKAAGFEMTIDNAKSGDLFGDILPKGDFQAGLYAQVLTALTPGNCNIFCSKNIPTADNGFSGNNWTRSNVSELDTQLEIVDTNLDESARIAAGKAADKLVAENALTFPLDPLPNTLLWSKKIVGPVQDNGVLGPFFNLAEWGVTA
jgi:peptide/nickel transport system substrate-binding protein